MPNDNPFAMRRRIPLQRPGTAAAVRELREQAGVLEVKSGRKVLRVCYDARTLSYGQLLDMAAEADLAPAAGRLVELRRAWFDYLDANAKANAAAPASPCCGNPREIYASRRRQGGP